MPYTSHVFYLVTVQHVLDDPQNTQIAMQYMQKRIQRLLTILRNTVHTKCFAIMKIEGCSQFLGINKSCSAEPSLEPQLTLKKLRRFPRASQE